jgi:hypothetical protein
VYRGGSGGRTTLADVLGAWPGGDYEAQKSAVVAEFADHVSVFVVREDRARRSYNRGVLLPLAGRITSDYKVDESSWVSSRARCAAWVVAWAICPTEKTEKPRLRLNDAAAHGGGGR